MTVLGKLASGTFVAGIVIVGLVAQASAFLLAFTSPTVERQELQTSFLAYSEAGPSPVGIRWFGPGEAPLPLTAWYPAAELPTDGSSVAYAYAINMLGPDGATAIGTFPGQAEPGAVVDLTKGPYPLVILSHGFAITASSYAWLAEHLASHGMVVIAPHHRESLDPALLWRSTFERPADLHNVLAFVDAQVRPGGEFEDAIDSQNVAIAGHSYGGYTTLAASGARIDTGGFNEACDSAYDTDDPLMFLCDALLPRFGNLAESADLDRVPPDLWPSWADERVDAAVTMAGDAAMFGEAGLSEIDVPVMAIGGTADIDSPFEWGTRLTYNHVSSTRKVEVSLEGAAHLIFAGECTAARRLLGLVSLGFCSDPTWNRTLAHDLVKHYVTAFVLAELNDDRTAAAHLAPSRQQISNVSYRAEGY
jgi:predicted dienelactone hydrolase